MGPQISTDSHFGLTGRIATDGRVAILILLIIAWLAQPSYAQVVVPPDLSPGDQYHMLFLSTPGTQVHDALSTDIEVYNTFITGVANSSPALVALSTTWRAVGCTPTISARQNTGIDPAITGVPIYRPDGVRVSNNYPSLWGGLLAAPNITETGAVGNSVPVSWAHTGCRSDGTPFPARELGGPIVAVRTGTFSFASAWLNATGRSRFEGASFYGISGVLTVPGPAGADLVVTKTDSVDPVIAGNELTYTVTVENNGPSDALNVVATDTLPAGVSFTSTTGCDEDPNGVATCTLGTIANGNSKQYTITVNVDSSTTGTITNDVSVTSDTPEANAGDESASEETTVNAAADLVITKTDSADPVLAGNDLTYTVTVENNGPSDALNVVATDTLPAGVTFDSTSGCDEDPNGVATCTLGTIADGASKQYTITVSVDSATTGVITNNVSVTSDTAEANAGDESASEETTVNGAAELVITKTDSVDPVLAGNELTYTITVQNNGPSDAQNVVVTDTLPAGVTFVSTSGCVEDPSAAPACSLGTVTSGSSKMYTLTVTVDSGTTGVITNNASVTSDTPGVGNGSGSTSEDTTVESEADLVITVADSNDPVSTLNSLTYTITVDNNGPSDALNVQVAETLAGVLTFVSTSGCAEDPDGVPTCDLGTIESGSSKDYTVEVDIDPDTNEEITNTATVTSDTTETVPADNTASEDTVIDLLVPAVTLLDSVESTDDGEVTECETIRSRLRGLVVTFSEDLAMADDPSHYQLVRPGPDATLDTELCGPLQNDDIAVTMDDIVYDAGSQSVSLAGFLASDLYRFFACPSLTDGAGNPLDGNGDGTSGDEFIRTFRYDRDNLLANANFDCDVEDWDQVPPGSGQIGHGSPDVDDSANSGSAHLDDAGGTGLRMEQCVAIGGAGTYLLQGMVRVDGMPGETVETGLECEFYASADCTGSPSGMSVAPPLVLGDTATLWQILELNANVPAGTDSALCAFAATASGGVPDAYFDAFSFQSSIFKDGFESGSTSSWRFVSP